jgi:hypothetical protein
VRVSRDWRQKSRSDEWPWWVVSPCPSHPVHRFHSFGLGLGEWDGNYESSYAYAHIMMPLMLYLLVWHNNGISQCGLFSMEKFFHPSRSFSRPYYSSFSSKCESRPSTENRHLRPSRLLLHRSTVMVKRALQQADNTTLSKVQWHTS